MFAARNVVCRATRRIPIQNFNRQISKVTVATPATNSWVYTSNTLDLNQRENWKQCWTGLRSLNLTDEQETCISRWGGLKPVALGFEELMAMPEGFGPSAVQMELCIRLAQSVAQLDRLPSGLTERVGVQAAIDLYADSIMDIEKADCTGQAWTQTLLQAHQLHSAVQRLLLREAHAFLAEHKEAQHDLDDALEKFNSTHKSVEFLTKHVLQSQQGGAGAIRNVRLSHIARDAAKAARTICTKAMGAAPAIDVEVQDADNLMCDPDIVRYTLVELMKNACKASVERKGSAVPRVSCVVESMGPEDDAPLAVRIIDRGVGIAAEDQAKIWSYTYSTSKSANAAGVAMGDQQALGGFGVGLPFSRLCARYFGGDLTLKSVQGKGTEVCLQLDRSARREHLCEALPHAAKADEVGNLGEFLDWQAAAKFHESLDVE